MAAVLRKYLNDEGFSPSNSRINFVAREVSNRIHNKNEQAMFLSHVIHETAGLQILEENCSNPSAYNIGERYRNKSYHGRGFLHLSHPANYLEASEGLQRGKQLWMNPELVSEDLQIGMDTALWFWKEKVVRYGVPSKYRQTTKAINGGLEDGTSGASQTRYKYYCGLSKMMGNNPMSL